MNYDSNLSIIQQTPLLSSEDLHRCVNHYFNLGYKYFDDIKSNGLPVYVLDKAIIRERILQFRNAFQDALHETAFYYALKSNNHPDVISTVVNSGFGLDVSSGLELETAVRAGAEDIVFSGPGKTGDELSKAVQYSDKVTVLIDSFGELARLQDAASAKNRVVRAGVRLSASKDSLWRKFGIAPEELPLFAEDASKCSHVKFCGIQFHCSWNRSPDAQVDFISKLGRILSGLPDFCREEIEFVDIGGGYWPPQGEWLQAAGTREGKIKKINGIDPGNATDHYHMSSYSIEDFAFQLSSALRNHLYPIVSCKICFEPGRWICNDAMHLILTVVDKKSDDLVITDAGTNAIGWERFETDYCPVLNLTRPALQEKACNIMGSLCTPHDVWGYTYWGDDIQEGDILMIPEQGAYTFSLRQNFIKPLPRVLTL